MSEFSYSESRRKTIVGPSWLTVFTAVLTANVLAGIIFFLCLRAYIYWSITDTMQQIQKRIDSK